MFWNAFFEGVIVLISWFIVTTEVFKNHVGVYGNCIKVFKIVFRNYIRMQDY